ncbi:unnamed protein product [Protopolystoma xenopodis]|uniref:Uncharacterized protein n=1 Tax=Protopolystoma xenopodis TaxID=117903 RepID=A0A3S4ZNS8_9PLAT|nr:unnamed protein product [Protopolystoma xenopodis]
MLPKSVLNLARYSLGPDTVWTSLTGGVGTTKRRQGVYALALLQCPIAAKHIRPGYQARQRISPLPNCLSSLHPVSTRLHN